MCFSRARDVYMISKLKEEAYNDFSDSIKLYDTASKKNPLYPIRAYYNGTEEGFESLKTNMPESPIQYLQLKDMQKEDFKNKDIVIVDFPATVNYNPDLYNLLLSLNALIIPVSFWQEREVYTQQQYCHFIKTLFKIENCNFKNNVHILWTRGPQHNPNEPESAWTFRVNEELQEQKEAAKFPFPSFNSVIPESNEIRESTFLTILPLAHDKIASKSVENLIQEIFIKVLK
jgi:cellulose biosynthesis protein BcsQ